MIEGSESQQPLVRWKKLTIINDDGDDGLYKKMLQWDVNWYNLFAFLKDIKQFIQIQINITTTLIELQKSKFI